MPVGWWERAGGIALWVVLPTLFIGPWWLVMIGLQALVIGALLAASLFTR